MSEEKALEDKKKKRLRRFFILFPAALAVIVLDQWTKWLVRRDIPLGTSWLPDSLEWLSPYARLHHIQNKGASFGMFQDGNILFIALTFLIVGGILFYISKMEHDSDWMWIAGGLYLGGALGNLIDRLIFGAVTDFVSVGSFYIFNVADASINVSVAMLVILFWLGEKKPAESSDSGGNP